MLTVGKKVITPSGRLATVKKILSGKSRQDCFERVICQYDGEKGQDGLVTLQPHILKKTDDTREKLFELLGKNETLSVANAAKKLNVSEDTIIAMIRSNKNIDLCIERKK